MNIEKIWQQESESDDELNKVFGSDFNKLQSKLPLKKLKNNLLITILWAVLITIGYIALLFYVSAWQVLFAFGVLIVFNIVIMVDSWKLYKKTPSFITPSNSLKEELTLQYNSFQRWWKVQEKFSLFVYPIAAAGGFVLGGIVGSGKPVEVFLYNPIMLIILGVCILVTVPVCYYLARWMFNYAYGKDLKKIKATIDELS